MLAWVKRQIVRLLQWMVSVPMPAGPTVTEPALRRSRKTKTVAQMKREARKRRNIEKKKR